MAMDKVNDPQVIEIGTLLTDEYAYETRGNLMAACKPLPASLVGSHDVALVSNPFECQLVDESQAPSVPVDLTYSKIAPVRWKGMFNVEASSEVLEDGSLLRDLASAAANALGNFKNERIAELWQANAGGSTVADMDALSLDDILSEAEQLPNASHLPHVIGSPSVYHSLKRLEFNAGFDSGEMNIAGLPFIPYAAADPVLSGDVVCFVGYPSMACGAAQLPDRVNWTSESAGPASAINDMKMLIGITRLCGAWLNGLWLRKIELA